MSDTLPADHKIGANKPPLETPEELAIRLNAEAEPLWTEAANLDALFHDLPERPENDEEAGRLTDAGLKIAAFEKKVVAFHKREKEPYLAAGRIVDALKNDLVSTPLERLVDVKSRLTIFGNAKREKERAERAEQERIAREKAQAAERERLAAEAAAREQERKAAAAAEAIRAAANKEARDKAEREMREANAEAAEQRKAAEASAKEGAAAERQAETHGKAASGALAGASTVTAGGGSSSGTQFWNYRIEKPSALLASLGPLASFLADSAVGEALGRCAKAQATDKTDIPGVAFFKDTRTTLRGARS